MKLLSIGLALFVTSSAIAASIRISDMNTGVETVTPLRGEKTKVVPFTGSKLVCNVVSTEKDEYLNTCYEPGAKSIQVAVGLKCKSPNPMMRSSLLMLTDSKGVTYSLVSSCAD